MQDFIMRITTVEWLFFGLVTMALLAALMAWRRAGRALQLLQKLSVTDNHLEVEPVQEQAGEQRPAVSLEVFADKDENEKVTLSIRNNGLLAARKISLSIETPINIFDTEGISSGLESANVTESSVILPRLAVLDAENKFPIDEITSDQLIELPAALTMSHGKICEFPVSLRWHDENGDNHKVELTLMV